jgi:hypothetical protein
MNHLAAANNWAHGHSEHHSVRGAVLSHSDQNARFIMEGFRLETMKIL